jgi:hypothetical protein
LAVAHSSARRGSGHVVLLGDSIFDNRAYTSGEPDVVAHLTAALPADWNATLLAVDGATVGSLARQFDLVPATASDLVLSVGGNDALMNSDLLDTRVRSSSDALRLFAARLEPFEAAYRGALTRLASFDRHAVVCTIYNGALEADQAPLARVALMTFNDVILRAAFERKIDVIDLRQICVDPADYANAIEPSGIGGGKIAAAIARAVGAVPAAPATRVYGA